MRPYDEQGSAVQARELGSAANILGVGLGVAEDALGAEPGATCLTLYVEEPMSLEQAKQAVVDSMGVSAASSDDVAVNVIVTGPIDAQSFTFKMRPAPGGVSVGHVKVTAGTLGCLARGKQAPRSNRVLILSNNHVLANSNSAAYGDCIIQPGKYDGGLCPRDRIAILERYVRIGFGAGHVNYVDCATGWAWHALVRKELLYRHSSGLRLFRISSAPKGCAPGMLVGKTGRTTELTAGRVLGCSASIWVNYGGGLRAFFKDQIAIRGLSGDFSRGGDSGSVIWTWDGTRNPVGLLFAGGGGYTFANKIGRVLAYLDINLYT
jgi:hypothetical protein